MIGLNQQQRFGRTFGSPFNNPNLVKYAEAFGLPGFRVARPDDLLPTLKRVLDWEGPSLVEDRRWSQPVKRGDAKRAIAA